MKSVLLLAILAVFFVAFSESACSDFNNNCGKCYPNGACSYCINSGNCVDSAVGCGNDTVAFGCPCTAFTDCTNCSTNTSCGWCASSFTCIVGSSTGPTTSGDCTASSYSWSYTSCPEFVNAVNTAFQFVGLGLAAFIGILVAIFCIVIVLPVILCIVCCIRASRR